MARGLCAGQFKSIDSEFGVDARWLLYLVPVSDPTDKRGT